jgi:hypothetical protein
MVNEYAVSSYTEFSLGKSLPLAAQGRTFNLL